MRRSLTWSLWECHTQRGRRGPTCGVRVTRVSQSGNKAQPSALTSPRHTQVRSPSAGCALKRTADTELYALPGGPYPFFLFAPDLPAWFCLEAFPRPVFWLSRPVLLSCGRFDPELQVTHEAGSRSKDGSVQEAVEGEEADPRGVYPAVPASVTAHPSYQCEYERVKKCEVFTNHKNAFTLRTWVSK